MFNSFRRLFSSTRKANPVRRKPPCIRPWLERLEDRTLPSNINWLGAYSTDYNYGPNWQGGVVPTSLDTPDYGASAVNNCVVSLNKSVAGVTLESTFARSLIINAGVDLAAANISMAGGTVDGAGTLESTSALTWSGGTMAGTGITLVDPAALLGLALSNVKTLDGRHFQLNGNATVTGAGDLTLKNAATINIGSATITNVTLDIQNDFNIKQADSSACAIVNWGTFQKTGGTPGTASQVGVAFTNNGTVLATSKLDTFGNPQGLQFVFAGKFVFNGTTLDGDGQLEFDGTFEWLAGSMGNTGANGTGRTVLKGQSSLNGTNTFTIRGRALDNYGTFTFTGTNQTTPLTLIVRDANSALTNYGTKSLAGNVLFDTSQIVGGGPFTNANSGLITVDSFLGPPPPSFGTVEIHTSTFNNDGRVQVVSEVANKNTLSITTGGKGFGMYDVGGNALIAFDGLGANNTQTVIDNPANPGNPPVYSGAGLYQVKGKMTLWVSSIGLSISNLELRDPGSSINVAGGLSAPLFNWYDGQLTGSGTLTIQKNQAMNIQATVDAAKGINQLKIINNGVMTWFGSNFDMSNTATITIDDKGVAGQGVFDIQSDNTITNGDGKAGNIILQGAKSLLKKSKSPGGNATEIVPKIQIPAGGGNVDLMKNKITFETAQNSGGDFNVDGGVAVVLGLFQQDGGTSELNGGSMSVGGNFVENGGTFTMGMSGSLSVSGALQENGGIFTLTYGGVTATGGFQIAQGADLTCRGSITGNVTNSGTIDVGGTNATGTISITGNFTQTSTGLLNMEIGPSAGQYDKLAVSGLDTLGGTLYVTFIGGFIPHSGQVFSLLTYGSRSGTFASLSIPTYSGGHLNPKYDDPTGTCSLWAV